MAGGLVVVAAVFAADESLSESVFDVLAEEPALAAGFFGAGGVSIRLV